MAQNTHVAVKEGATYDGARITSAFVQRHRRGSVGVLRYEAPGSSHGWREVRTRERSWTDAKSDLLALVD